MATSIQILQDGPRNVTVKYVGVLTADMTEEVVVDPAALSDYDINGVKATKLRVDRIQYDVEDLLAINLLFEGSVDAPIWYCVGRGIGSIKAQGGISNNATNPTGKIVATSNYTGTSSTPLSFSIILDLVKQ